MTSTRTRKRSTAGLAAATSAAGFGLDVWSVMALRMMKLAAGGPAAALEANRMVAEKVAAAWEAQAVAAAALVTGASQKRAHRKAHAVYRRHVRANRRRLAPR